MDRIGGLLMLAKAYTETVFFSFDQQAEGLNFDFTYTDPPDATEDLRDALFTTTMAGLRATYPNRVFFIVYPQTLGKPPLEAGDHALQIKADGGHSFSMVLSRLLNEMIASRARERERDSWRSRLRDVLRSMSCIWRIELPDGPALRMAQIA
ncbi:hypothetical protein [Rhizobium terrae]|uniref:hypothetical protein n=1 Tax=Rhizobium terrae TaxID=2171756 RepID=UPI000E3C5C92|nr:hypothetical protein [Rhizobium terrae]